MKKIKSKVWKQMPPLGCMVHCLSKKAFVNSLITILMSLLLLQLYLAFQLYSERTNTIQSGLFTIKYADYYFDDIAYDISHLASETPSMRRINDTYIAISFTNKATNLSFQSAVANYSQKITPILQKLGGNISINLSAISNNAITYAFSDGVIYSSNYSNPVRSSVVRTSSAATFRNFSIIFVTNLTRTALNDFVYAPSGNYYVKMNYTDANGNYLSQGYLVPGPPANEFIVNFTSGDSFNASINDAGGNAQALTITRNNIPTLFFNVNTIIQNSNTSEVFMTVPVYLNIIHAGYSKTGLLIPLRN